MKFREQLAHYRDRARLSKTGVAEKMHVTPTYYMELESGRKRPPPPDRCKSLIEILHLNAEEARRFLDTAIKERISEEVTGWLNDKETITKVPILSWVKANQFSEAMDVLVGEEYVSTTNKGENIFALRVKGDCMEPEFIEDDLIIINPNIEAMSNDYVVVLNKNSNEATFKQLKKTRGRIILHPLNENNEDIDITGKSNFKIIGVVIEKTKKYKSTRSSA